jgi:hypothetical protein
LGRYDDIKNFVATRGLEECGAAPDGDFYLVDVTLNNALDDDDGLLAIRAWNGWPENMDHGRVIEWPLGAAGIVPPQAVPQEDWYSVAAQLFVVDQLPERVAALTALLATPGPAWAGGGKPVVMVVHCSAGCDRTSEVIGAFRMTYDDGEGTPQVRSRLPRVKSSQQEPFYLVATHVNMARCVTCTPQVTAADMYNMNCAECGRPPNYYSTHAQEWYCILLESQGVTGLGDCTGFATCEPLGSCEPTTTTTPK